VLPLLQHLPDVMAAARLQHTINIVAATYSGQ